MNYVASDLHGEDEKFEQLLRLIRFSSSDKLFVIGDVIDRGKDPIKLLLKIMRIENVVLILGNHEEMMLRAVKYGGRWEDIRLATKAHTASSPSRTQCRMWDAFITHSIPRDNTLWRNAENCFPSQKRKRTDSLLYS